MWLSDCISLLWTWLSFFKSFERAPQESLTPGEGLEIDFSNWNIEIRQRQPTASEYRNLLLWFILCIFCYWNLFKLDHLSPFLFLILINVPLETYIFKVQLLCKEVGFTDSLTRSRLALSFFVDLFGLFLRFGQVEFDKETVSDG